MSDDRYRCSFDLVSDKYERARPGYAEDAIDWIAQRLPFERVLDLAAGTGKLTRQLVARGIDVVAVEPGEAMRAVLERVVPEATVRTGSAEAIPLEDASVDAVTVGQAFHWFRAGEALAEIHRVVRPGGGFALVANQWDDDDPLLHELNGVVEALRPAGSRAARDSSRAALETTTLFAGRDERAFRHAERLEADTVVDRVASVSAVAAAAPALQAQVEERVRELVGAGPVDFPLITKVLVATRVETAAG